ncbi:MAG: hypothetical protein A3B68_01820 [Candidatus Melainabacteria bacterium RIFCSPHIGHO2_02_FULL_34_12]|nr:MAG: hypothetical protein A3B68_01820 [Candidatus Melainabacteria bacterium RIFCSPHIGHO2_02_FULL_34_12]
MNAKETIVKLSSSALEELKKLVQKEANNPDGVRLSLLAGGCSGLSYHMEFDKKKENDLIDEYGEIKVLIDPKSALYLHGVMLDYQGGLTGRGFVFANPNAAKSCGCGTSFSVGDKDVTLEFKQNTNSNVCPSTQQK